jgi:hypothetical protein
MEHADTIQDLLAEGLRIATTLFPTKTTSPRTANMTKRRYWTKTVQRDVSTLRNRATLLRRLAKLHTTMPLTQQDTLEVKINTTKEIKYITNILTTPPTPETPLHKPLRANVMLCLPTNNPNSPPTPHKKNNNEILACYKEHRIATRLTIKHANRSRYNKYEAALLQMFVRKSRDALKSIFKTSSKDIKH